MGTIDYRFVIVNPAAATPYAPGDATVSDEHWWVTSLRGGTRPYIESPPTHDGQEVDLLTGKVQDGASRVRVLDLDGSTDDTGSSANDELNDTGLWSRWSESIVPTRVGYFGFGSPGGEPTTFGVSFGGTTLVGLNQTPASEQYLTRTFGAADGIQPSTLYNVTVKYKNYGIASILDLSVYFPNATAGRSPPEPFLGIGGFGGLGRDVGASKWYYDGSAGWDYLKSAGTSTASGTLTVNFGVQNALGGLLSWAMLFDWVHITEATAPGNAGPYVTVNLADTVARQQFLGRQAFIEYSFDRGATWSKVLHCGYVTDIVLDRSLVYEFSIGDTRRIERTTKAFKRRTTTFGNITPIIGGPTMDGWADIIPFYGRPTFFVEYSSPSTYNADGTRLTQGEVIFRYVSGPMPAAYYATGDNLTRANFDVINERARPFWVPDGGVPDIASPVNTQRLSPGQFPRLRLEVFDVNGIWPTGLAQVFTPWSWAGVDPALWQARLPSHVRRSLIKNMPPWLDTLMGEGGRLRVPWDYPSVVLPPTVGDFVELALYPLDISDEAPLHIYLHPVDIVTGLYLEHGVPYNATTATAVRNALGTDLRVALRITAPIAIQELSEQLFATFDFATRIGVDGDREFFTVRRKGNSTPAVTIDDDTLREEGGPTFALSESSKCNQVRATQHRFQLDQFGPAIDRVWDDIKSSNQQVIADLVTAWPDRSDYQRDTADPTLDSAVFGEKEQAYEIPGTLMMDTVGEISWKAFARGLSEQIFDRQGRGAQATTLVTRRGDGADDLALGDEVRVAISHHPNAQFNVSPSSTRGGARVATVVRKQEAPEGCIYAVVDAGTGTQPFDIEPYAGRWSALQSPANPSVALLKINNQASWPDTLIQANARILVEVAFGASQPTVNGVHYTTIDPAELEYTTNVGDWEIPLGPFATTVGLWVRIQTFVPGASPSQWGDWTNVTVGGAPGTGTISNLTVASYTDTTVSLQWTNTDTIQPVTVSMRVTGGGAYSIVATLPPGSTRYTVTGLTANTSYDFMVTLTDGQNISVVQVTANAGLSQLPAPIAPVAIANGFGVYGLRVVSTVAPATVVFESAVETSVGSGTAGTFVEYGRTPAVLNISVSQSTTAANDGKKRYVRAKLTWPGYIDSAYTSPLEVDPWSGTAPPPNPPGGGPGGPPVIVPPGGTPPAIPPGTIPPTRYVSQIAALALASDTDASGTVWVGTGSTCHRVTANGPCRLRLYDLSAERTADTARAINTEADTDDCVLDVVLHPTQTLDLRLKPRAVLGSAETPPVNTLFYLVRNLSGTTADVLVELHLSVYAP